MNTGYLNDLRYSIPSAMVIVFATPLGLRTPKNPVGDILSYEEWTELRLRIEETYRILGEIGGIDMVNAAARSQPAGGRRSEPMQRDGHIYLLHSAETGYCKIGRARSVQERVDTLGIQLPFRIDLLHWIACQDMVMGEKYLHDRFHDKRANGEWFLLDQAEIDWIKGLVAPFPWDIEA